MMVIASILILFVTAIFSCFGIAVLRHPRHQGARILLAAAALIETLMAIGLGLLVALPAH